MSIKFYLSIYLVFFVYVLTSAQTRVQQNDGQWQFIIDAEAFKVKGATFGYDDDVTNYDDYFKELKFLGVNSIRTWGTGEHTGALLDAAEKYNIKVMLGIWMRHGRPGAEADDSFDYLQDKAGMEEMYNNAVEVVRAYKDHPALLLWGVGNEVYINTGTDEEKLAYSIFLERVCSTIKRMDDQHPIASVEAWTFGLDWWEKHVPSLDVYGLNSYGPGAGMLSEELKKRDINKPYLITEFGVMGAWDMPKDENGVTQEPDDAQKYKAIAQGYPDWIDNKDNCLGVYVFHYGNSNEYVGPWLLTHFKGKTRPQYWAIREAYTGKKPLNYVPEIQEFQFTDNNIKSGKNVTVNLKATDAENELLSVEFYYNQRTGSRKRRDQLTPLVHRGNLNEGFELQMPEEDGAIKVYAVVSDTYSNAGIATSSIIVKDKKAAQRKFLVPKVEFPFYVYREGIDLPYTPSAYMGDYENMSVDLSNTEEVYSGDMALKISYTKRSGWYGFGFVDPANDWGDILGGYDLSGAETFSFWAKANITNVKINVGFGLIEGDKPYPDSAIKMQEIVLTKTWKKYSIKTKKLDLSCIRSGFVLFSSADGFDHEVYIDDIVFE
jgi:hypothetical protein